MLSGEYELKLQQNEPCLPQITFIYSLISISEDILEEMGKVVLAGNIFAPA